MENGATVEQLHSFRVIDPISTWRLAPIGGSSLGSAGIPLSLLEGGEGGEGGEGTGGSRDHDG